MRLVPLALIPILFLVTSSAVPKLSGVFLEIYWDVVPWTAEKWSDDLDAMLRVGIRQIAIGEVLSAYWPNFSLPSPSPKDSNCSVPTILGPYSAFYPASLGPCVTSVGNPVGIILNLAEQKHMEVHLGLALPRMWPTNGSEAFAAFASFQMQVLKDLWRVFGNYSRSSWKGVYTTIETSNDLDLYYGYAESYLAPIAELAKSLNPHFAVWASPYFTRTGNASPQEWAAWWGKVFQAVPAFDLIAPQDGVGTHNNSLAFVSEYFSALRDISNSNKRPFWSNPELMLLDCPTSQYCPPNCNTRRPAGASDFHRIKAQLETEAPFTDAMVSWEWHAYLDPFAGTCSWLNLTIDAYVNYLYYVNPNY